MNDLDPLWLRSFVAIARHGSVTAAAREVHRTQSAVSTHLRQLEASVGVALAVRTTRALALTAEGERFLPHAQRLLAMQDEARAAVRGVPERPWRIGISEYFLPARLAELLALLQVHTAPAGLELLWSSSTALQALWAAGEVDLAVVTSPGPLPGARLLRREPLAWVHAPGFVMPPPAAPMPLVLLGPGCPVREIALQALQRAGRAHHVRLSCAGSHGAVAAIRAGWGVGCLNTSAVVPDLVPLRGWRSPGRLSFQLLARPGLEATAQALHRWAGGGRPTLAG